MAEDNNENKTLLEQILSDYERNNELDADLMAQLAQYIYENRTEENLKLLGEIDARTSNRNNNIGSVPTILPGKSPTDEIE
jgi:hypothetical protein